MTLICKMLFPSISTFETPPHFYQRGTYDQAIAFGQHALALATASGDVVVQAMTNGTLGIAYQAQADYRRAIDYHRPIMVSLGDARSHERFGQVNLPTVISRADLAWCHAELGMFAEGRALGEEGLRIAEAADHPGSLMFAYYGVPSAVPPPGDLLRARPSSNGLWAFVRTWTSWAGSPGWLRPWVRRILYRPHH